MNSGRMQPADGLNEVFQQKRLQLANGEIVWGALVQTNSQLFEPGTADCPAPLVHSPDHYFDAHPSELRLLGKTSAHPESRAFVWTLSRSDAPGHPVRADAALRVLASGTHDPVARQAVVII